jgi:general secretion pathway protein B
MSYILDALRRADAERDRGRVPGIHARAPIPVAEDPGAAGVAPPWRWIGVGVLLGLLVVLAAWWLTARDPPPAEAGPPVAPVAPPPIPQAEPGALPEPAVIAPALPPIEQRPTAEAAAAAARKAASRASAPSAVAAPASAASTRIYARNELPEEIRRQLPNLSIGGSIYSPSPANRFVVINGQVVHENGEIGPDHVLETIRLKSAVLRFKGYRYEINF